MKQVARHIIWKGRVQGVGFRYTVRQMAAKYELTGTVRNCFDGSVEAVLQGTPQQVQSAIDDIAAEFHGYIREVDASEQVVNPHLTDFSIIH